MTRNQPRTEVLPGEHRQPLAGEWLPEGSTGTARAAPPLAFQALDTDRQIGLLLPCNVVVRATDGGTVVDILDPQIMVSLTKQSELKPIADEARRRLDTVLAALASDAKRG